MPVKDTWLVIGGRGSGKTRLGAEWVNSFVRGYPPFADRSHGLIALVGETLGDVREVMIDGPSGIARISRHDRPRFEPSRKRLVWECGAVAHIFSSEDPESLRGPQFEAAWCDEVAKWKHADACFDMLQFGLRLGERPRQLLTTTPKPIALLRRLLSDADVSVTRMRTDDNAKNLAESFLKAVRQRYAGTHLGRQELDGEFMTQRENALWIRTMLEQAIAVPEMPMRRIVIAVDPPASAHRRSDACGIVVAGMCEDGLIYVLADETVGMAKPHDWACRVVRLFHRFEADRVVAEVNQGGDMVEAVIRTIDPQLPVKPVRATRGKWLRAEPVAALYEQGRVRHAGRFGKLEDEMCDFGIDGISSGRSPDRVDALVWAITELAGDGSNTPRIRNIS